MTDNVEITTGSRLHFGPLFCGRTSGRRFGGVGLMIDQPRCRVTIRRSVGEERLVPPELRPNVEKCLAGMTDPDGKVQPVRVDVHESIPRHRGLGSGTQTALAVAQGIHVLQRGESAEADMLARITGRGLRSAIGIHGFQRGGFLIDAGKRDGDAIGALAARCDVPDDWRFVLIAPRDAAGLSGQTERDAFRRLPAMPPTTSAELCRIALTELLPAVRSAEFAAFAEALYDYGQIVGGCFAPVQGGCFAHPEMSRLAAELRAHGFAGVAQSSWGPTIALVVTGEEEARELADAVRNRRDVWCEIARPRNGGATVVSV
jgi:beta-ribofuranosylaminobenzene 5'-phosphate synthase